MEGGGSGLNLARMFISGGWVMYPILALSVLMVTFIFERVVVLMIERIRLSPLKALDNFWKVMEKNSNDKFQTVDEMMNSLKKNKGICSRVLQVVFHKFRDGSSKKMSPIELKKWMTDGAESQATIDMPALESHLGYLAVISNVATLMGLFGTVFGMIESFTAMADSPGGVKADEMAGGIAIALVATLFGLCVAVPSLILYNVLKVQIETYVHQTEEACVKIIDALVE